MRKISLFALLGASLVLVGCGPSSQGDTSTNGEFSIDTCNKYIELLECSMKDLSEDYKASSLQDLEEFIEGWKAVPEEELRPICDGIWEQIVDNADIYEGLGCPIN